MLKIIENWKWIGQKWVEYAEKLSHITKKCWKMSEHWLKIIGSSIKIWQKWPKYAENWSKITKKKVEKHVKVDQKYKKKSLKIWQKRDKAVENLHQFSTFSTHFGQIFTEFSIIFNDFYFLFQINFYLFFNIFSWFLINFQHNLPICVKFLPNFNDFSTI